MIPTVEQQLSDALAAAREGRIAEAERAYGDILDRFPFNRAATDALRRLQRPLDDDYALAVHAVLNLYDQGRFADMIERLAGLIDQYPRAADLHNLAGAAHNGLGQADEALASYEAAIRLNPRDGDVRSNRGIVLLRQGRHYEALESCRAATELQPDNAAAHSNHGMVLRYLGRLDEALACYDRAIRLQPRSADIHYNRANLLSDLERYVEAIAAYDATIALRADHAAAHCNRGSALRKLDRLHEARAAYEAALQLKPDFAEALSNRGSVLKDLKRPEEALQSCERAAQLQPGSAEIHYNLGTVLQELRRYKGALASYVRAIELKPDHAEAYANSGAALVQLGRLEEALGCYGKMVRLRPGLAAAHYNRGAVLQQLHRLDEAVTDYSSAISLQPDYAEALGQLAYQRARMCDWGDDGPAIDIASLGITTDAIPPFALIALDDSGERHLARARKYVGQKYRSMAMSPPRPKQASAPIRIGYFSADFHNHATMHLMSRMLELHDRARFEIHAFSYGSREDEISRRTAHIVDHFHDMRGLSDREAAELARRHRIDIAVDLKGHTHESRLGIFAQRPAPVQIAFLGYPGSTGAPFIDYLIADEIVAPDAHAGFFSEKLIHLPYSYQVNDDRQPISDIVFSRAKIGLPEKGFVFASFNGLYKIQPEEFSIWMRLLARIDGSVLWLLRDNRWAEANLRREAEARGVDPARLIFSERLSPAEHLARHRCADLFLDSFACNAHTTASDALWAGLPLITRLGESFTARVAASLLHAVGLPELVTTSADEYERLALALATDAERLAGLRSRLVAARDTAPLFDTRRFTRNIERAYEIAYQRLLSGAAPMAFKVPAIGDHEDRAAA